MEVVAPRRPAEREGAGLGDPSSADPADERFGDARPTGPEEIARARQHRRGMLAQVGPAGETADRDQGDEDRRRGVKPPDPGDDRRGQGERGERGKRAQLEKSEREKPAFFQTGGGAVVGHVPDAPALPEAVHDRVPEPAAEELEAMEGEIDQRIAIGGVFLLKLFEGRPKVGEFGGAGVHVRLELLHVALVELDEPAAADPLGDQLEVGRDIAG